MTCRRPVPPALQTGKNVIRRQFSLELAVKGLKPAFASQFLTFSTAN